MGPTSSGLDTLMALAARCAANSFRSVARTWLVVACGAARGLVVEHPRQETAATSSAGIGLRLIIFMTSLPFCFQIDELILLYCEWGRAPKSCPAPLFDHITSLHDHSRRRSRDGHVSGRITSARGQRVSPDDPFPVRVPPHRVRRGGDFGAECSAVEQELHASYPDIVRCVRRDDDFASGDDCAVSR